MAGKLELGTLVVTENVANRAKKEKAFYDFLVSSLSKYYMGMRGDTCADDEEVNNQAIINGENISAVYIYPADRTKIWITTEWDRSVTTILYPWEH